MSSTYNLLDDFRPDSRRAPAPGKQDRELLCSCTRTRKEKSFFRATKTHSRKEHGFFRKQKGRFEQIIHYALAKPVTNDCYGCELKGRTDIWLIAWLVFLTTLCALAQVPWIV